MLTYDSTWSNSEKKTNSIIAEFCGYLGYIAALTSDCGILLQSEYRGSSCLFLEHDCETCKNGRHDEMLFGEMSAVGPGIHALVGV